MHKFLVSNILTLQALMNSPLPSSSSPQSIQAWTTQCNKLLQGMGMMASKIGDMHAAHGVVAASLAHMADMLHTAAVVCLVLRIFCCAYELMRYTVTTLDFIDQHATSVDDSYSLLFRAPALVPSRSGPRVGADTAHHSSLVQCYPHTTNAQQRGNERRGCPTGTRDNRAPRVAHLEHTRCTSSTVSSSNILFEHSSKQILTVSHIS